MYPILLLTLLINAVAMKQVDPKVELVANNMEWLGQAAVKVICQGKTIYIDPYKLTKSDSADIVLITHSHSDHWSIDDIKKVVTSKTTLIAPIECLDEVKDLPAKAKIGVIPGFKQTVDGIAIEAVPAYNVVKTKFHGRDKNFVGYILNLDGVKLYHTGDTERIPEMKSINADIILLPLGQTYTMNSVEEAAESAKDVKASIAIPIHYGMYEGTSADAEKFKSLLEGSITVIIKKPR
ncbi:L-ascorbate metabolism protein UlaG, beta-lactamase superfamily [Williamwhitmania taraxaci]|uniref:L-ascorbate metabolism protein UlaG, beta-lactamase superfamily n=2 Tax=Williamwhitmania taraxaci TaxID=1640674 RepID=A0A1G6Q445_9BACT|nr:L-ascorbate metabolism protein UlaG, beta-lactamase superfamily [Williamwhitmania taraxaci]